MTATARYSLALLAMLLGDMIGRAAELEEKAPILVTPPLPLEQSMAPVLAEAEETRQLIAALREYDGATPGLSGLGAVGQLQARADRYTVERRSRQDLQSRVEALLAALEQWMAAEEERRQAALREAAERDSRKASKPVVAAAAVPTVNELDLSSFGYFELQQAATLQEISALPEVYGDPRLWQAIYQINRNQIEDPETPLPAGTVLKIPHLPPNRDLKYE